MSIYNFLPNGVLITEIVFKMFRKFVQNDKRFNNNLSENGIGVGAGVFGATMASPLFETDPNFFNCSYAVKHLTSYSILFSQL